MNDFCCYDCGGCDDDHLVAGPASTDEHPLCGPCTESRLRSAPPEVPPCPPPDGAYDRLHEPYESDLVPSELEGE